MPLSVQCGSTTCGTVNGTVTASESSQPLKGARVEWAGLAEVWGDRGDGVLTDGQGTYSIRIGPLGGPGSGQGQLMMRASKDGYVFRIFQVTLPASQPINFSLPAA